MAKYSLQRQSLCLEHKQECYESKAPSLAVARSQIGTKEMLSWISVLLVDLSEYSGVKDKITPAQLSACAKTILYQYSHFNLDELLLFFAEFKAKEEFFGSVDPMHITRKLDEFSKKREEKRTWIEQQEAKIRKDREWEEHLRVAISREEYERMRQLDTTNLTINEYETKE